MTITSPVAVRDWLRTNGFLSESLVREFAFERFGYDVKVVLEQVIDTDGALLTPRRLVTIRMQAVQEVQFIGALGEMMVDHPERINWGLSEVATVRLVPIGECCRLVLAWENDRRATVIAHRVELDGGSVAVETVWVLEAFRGEERVARWALPDLSDEEVLEHLGWLPEGLWTPSESLLALVVTRFGIECDPSLYDELLIGREQRAPWSGSSEPR